MDRIRRIDYDNSAVGDGIGGKVCVPAQLLYADRGSRGREHQPACTGLCKRTDIGRRPGSGICDGVPVGDVPKGAIGTVIDYHAGIRTILRLRIKI